MNSPATDTPQRASLALHGAITFERAAELQTILHDFLRPHTQLTLDLSAVTELDCAGLQLLMQLTRGARELQSGLELVEPSQAVREVFELVGLLELLPDTSTAQGDFGLFS